MRQPVGLTVSLISRQASSKVLQAFLTESDGDKVVMVADPPFGGLVKPLANSFSLISQTWRKLQSPGQCRCCAAFEGFTI